MTRTNATRQNRRDFLKLTAATAAAVFTGCDNNLLTKPPCPKTAKTFDPRTLTPTPPLGWSSWNCLGWTPNEKHLLENLEVFAKKLKPHGYEYFVIDAGWFNEYDILPGQEFPLHGSSQHVRIDQYGRSLPAKCSFPNGLAPIIDRAHALDIKFGLWLIRGVNRQAVENKLSIKGTGYTAADIANPQDKCSWCAYNYGVDMDKKGAQQYYNSIFDLLAGWGVDYVKYDDIVPFPREIEAVANAIRHCGRPIVLSLSPGGDINPDHVTNYKRANMVRITSDVWDRRQDLVKGFDRWQQMAPFAGQGFWLDLDMIPFGHLTIWNHPDKIGFDGKNLEDGRGVERMDNFTIEQKQAFLAQRALAASPLIMGGNLPGTTELVFSLIANPEMLACSRNGVTGSLVHKQENLDVYLAAHKSKPDTGWLGVFNRGEKPAAFTLSKQQLSLKKDCAYDIYDIWQAKPVPDAPEFRFLLAGDAVAFWRFSRA